MALDLVRHPDHRRLSDGGVIYQRGFHLVRPDAVSRDVDDIVDAPQQPEVAVFILFRAVTGEVHSRETAPVLFDVPVGIAINAAQHRRPGFSEHQVPALAGTDGFPLLIQNLCGDARERSRRRPGFQGRDPRQRRDEDHAGLGLPPGVHDRTPPAPDVLVVPDPGFGIDRFPHGPQQPQRRQVSPGRIVRTPLHECPDGGWCCVDDVDAVFFHDRPEPVLIGIIGGPFIHDRGRPVGQGAVDDIRMTGDPSDVRRAPEHVVVFQVEDPFGGQVGPHHVAARGVHDPLGLAGGPARIQDVEQVLTVQLFRLAHRRGIGHQAVPPVVATLLNVDGCGVAHAADHHDMFDRRRAGHRIVGVSLQRDDVTPPPSTVRGDEDFRLRVVDAVAQRLGGEPAEDHGVGSPNAGTGQHSDRQFGDHRQVDRDAIAPLDPQAFQDVGELADLPQQIAVGQYTFVAGLTLPDDSCLGPPAGLDVAIHAVVRDVRFPTDKPLGVWRRPLQHGTPLRKPVQVLGRTRPEPLQVLRGLVVHAFIARNRGLTKCRRRGKCPLLQQEGLNGPVRHAAPPPQ